jgi:hypothetical protein
MLCTEICSASGSRAPSQLGRAVNNTGAFTELDPRKKNDAAYTRNRITHSAAKLLQPNDPKGLMGFQRRSGQQQTADDAGNSAREA